MNIKSKVFVVTGGGNGIGRQVVLGLLARGARVAALDLSEDGLKETASLTAAGDRLSTHVVDITDRAAVLGLPDKIADVHGQVDGLINVAGIVQRFIPISDLAFDEIDKVMAVNFWGTVNTTKAFLPVLLQRPAAALVNVSSMGGLVPVPGQGAYGASKAAVKLFTEGLYAELHDSTLTVTVVFPGGVATDILGNSGVEMSGSRADSGKAAAKLTTPGDAARQIIEAIEKGAHRVRIGSDARTLDRLSRLVPQRAILLIARKMKGIAK